MTNLVLFMIREASMRQDMQVYGIMKYHTGPI